MCCVIASGAFITTDTGQSWQRIDDLPNQSFNSIEISRDNTMAISGMWGTSGDRYIYTSASGADSTTQTTAGTDGRIQQLGEAVKLAKFIV